MTKVVTNDVAREIPTTAGMLSTMVKTFCTEKRIEKELKTYSDKIVYFNHFLMGNTISWGWIFESDTYIIIVCSTEETFIYDFLSNLKEMFPGYW